MVNSTIILGFMARKKRSWSITDSNFQVPICERIESAECALSICTTKPDYMDRSIHSQIERGETMSAGSDVLSTHQRENTYISEQMTGEGLAIVIIVHEIRDNLGRS